MFSKPLSKLTWQDIEAVVTDQIPESQDLEFKVDLSSDNGKSKWYVDYSSIEPTARNKILKELIAFANATGGTLVIGIGESNTEPRRAAKINSLPKCKNLAERLKDQIGTGVEPKLQFFEIVGVSELDSDNGVVVIHIPKSVNGPHRHTHDKECYMRRGDKSEKMTMHEIHNLVLALSRSGDLTQEKFADRRKLFEKHFSSNSVTTEKVGVRMTAIPLEPTNIEKVHANPLFFLLKHPVITIENGNSRPLSKAMFYTLYSRPILRGTRYNDGDDGPDYAKVEIYNEGIIDISFVLLHKALENDREVNLYFEWIVYQLVLCLSTIDMVRCGTKKPSLSYALEIEIATTAGELSIRYGDNSSGSYVNRIGRPLIGRFNLLPIYPISNRESFQEIIDLVCSDIFDLVGSSSQPPSYPIDFSGLFDEIDKRQI